MASAKTCKPHPAVKVDDENSEIEAKVERFNANFATSRWMLDNYDNITYILYVSRWSPVLLAELNTNNLL